MRASSKGNKRDTKIKRTLTNDKDGDDADDVVDGENNDEERKKIKTH